MRTKYEEAFCFAAGAGHLRIMRALLEEGGVAVGRVTSLGRTSLNCAVENDRVEAARLLVTEWGVDVNRPVIVDGVERTPLSLAVIRGHTAMAGMLVLEGGADVDKGMIDNGAAPLYIAAHGGHTEIVRNLLERGADVDKATTDDGTTPLYVAAENGRTEIVRILLERGADVDKAMTDDGTTPLYIAAHGGHTEIVRNLLERGADVDKATTDDGTTPLYVAAQKGHTEIVRILLERGADPNKTTTDEYRCTPLHMAAQDGHTELVRMLVVEFKADVHKATANDGTTPLFIAALNGHTEVVRILLVEGGARIDQCDNDGWRPLHFAAHRDTCFALCALGADMDLSPPEGQDPPIVNDQPLARWFEFARGLGCALKVALERRDYDTAMHLLRNRLVDEPTAKLIREELLPIASTVGTHSLALPVCDKTRRVAEVASELHSNRWSQQLHALCGDKQRDAVKAVLTIMRWKGQGTGGDGDGARPRPEGEDETDDPYEQVGKLPRWMHSVIDDVWWKVLEMMGMW